MNNEISEFLRKKGAIGAENAMPLELLADAFGIADSVAKRYVQTERRNGSLICSNAFGYYMPKNRKEIAEFYGAARKVALSRLETLKAFRAALEAQDGQMELFEG